MHHVQAGADFEAIILVPRFRCRSHQIFGKRKLATATFLVPFGEVTPGALAGGLITLAVSGLMWAHPLESIIRAEPDGLQGRTGRAPRPNRTSSMTRTAAPTMHQAVINSHNTKTEFGIGWRDPPIGAKRWLPNLLRDLRKTREVPLEGKLDGARRTRTLFSDNNLSHTGLFGILVVHLVAVNEQDNVCVLLQ